MKYSEIKNLIKAINFARTYTKIEDKDINLIKHTYKTIITYNDKTWIKKDDNTLFKNHVLDNILRTFFVE